MLSVIIPAHNEEAVIGRCLGALLDGAAPGELEVLVVCNGCSDRTAEVAREFEPGVRVIETPVASKVHALNLGDAEARGFPRIYMDADVTVSLESVRELARVLEDTGVLACAPAVKTVFPTNTAWSVRAYYAFWMALPYVQEGMMAAGVYGLSREGRARFDRFPDFIADDGFVRLQFKSSERVEVASALSTVLAPSKLWDLVLIKTRSRLGYYQLRERCPQLFGREAQSKHYGKALVAILRKPALWRCVVPYLWVNVVSRYRGKRQLRLMHAYVWERDESSRVSETKCALSARVVE